MYFVVVLFKWTTEREKKKKKQQQRFVWRKITLKKKLVLFAVHFVRLSPAQSSLFSTIIKNVLCARNCVPGVQIMSTTRHKFHHHRNDCVFFLFCCVQKSSSHVHIVSPISWNDAENSAYIIQFHVYDPDNNIVWERVFFFFFFSLFPSSHRCFASFLFKKWNRFICKRGVLNIMW